MRWFLAVAVVFFLSGCPGGGMSVETAERAHQAAVEALDVAREALALAEVSGADPERVNAAQGVVVRLEAIAASWEAKVQEAVEGGSATVPWNEILTGLLTGAATLITSQKIRNGARRRRMEEV